MSNKTFNISFPKELADQIDRISNQQFGSRSDFLRMAAIKYLRQEKQWEMWGELTALSDELDNAIVKNNLRDEDIDRIFRETRREIYAERSRAKTKKSRTR